MKIINYSYPVICPDCHSPIRIRDSKRRLIKLSSGEKLYINLRRYKCLRCNNIHTELPDFMLPYKQYEKRVILNAKNGIIDGIGADSSTIRYWLK